MGCQSGYKWHCNECYKNKSLEDGCLTNDKNNKELPCIIGPSLFQPVWKKIHTIFVDRKVTIWERDTVRVSADSNEEAVLIAVDCETVNSSEILFETVETLSPSENHNQPTIEVLDEEGNSLYDNVNKFELDLIGDKDE